MAATKTTKPLPTMGIDMYTIFPLTKDPAEEGKATYGQAVSLPGITEIAPTDESGNAVFDADNGAYVSVPYVNNRGHELTTADIPAWAEAMLRGLSSEDGLVEVTDEVKAPYFGCAWRVMKPNGVYRLVRYYKGTYSFASAVGGQTNPSTGEPNFQTATATYTAVKRDSDGGVYGYLDLDALPEGVEAATATEGWFKSMDYKPEAV